MTEASFLWASSICCDPINPSAYFVGDSSSIRYVDTVNDMVSLIAGDATQGLEDGIGSEARFNTVRGLICNRAGDTLFAADLTNHRIVRVNIKLRRVLTLARHHQTLWRLQNPRKLVFDRWHMLAPESALYITSVEGITRYDLSTGDITSKDCLLISAGVARQRETYDLYGLISVPSGHLIVSCIKTYSLYVYEPISGEFQLLAESGAVDGPTRVARFWMVFDLAVADSEQCLYVADASNQCIRHVTLPEGLFRLQ